jgi:Spy/CpxP family protein refolding chaperone
MKTLKVIGLLVLIFVAGFAGGVVATRVVVRRMVAQAVAHPDATRDLVRTDFERNLARMLRLSPDQREKVHSILKDAHDRQRVLREEFQPQLNAIAVETRTNISSILRPEQQQRFEQFLADNRQFLPVHEPPPKKNPAK